ncbi:unnamed protein product [Vicia faba]|uniref:Uncharacterized protein n=1 Tax=Vicia faba TaxID=3906 RepID=A0AAV0ZYK8_VICFA|nr:unnamed protein product [Vicia faba]
MLFKTSDHKYVLKFTGGTSVGDVNKHVFPLKRGGCSSPFVLWDHESAQLLRVFATQLRATMLEVGICDPVEYPLQLYSLLGLTMIFKIKWNCGKYIYPIIVIVESTYLDFMNSYKCYDYLKSRAILLLIKLMITSFK